MEKLRVSTDRHIIVKYYQSHFQGKRIQQQQQQQHSLFSKVNEYEYIFCETKGLFITQLSKLQNRPIKTHSTTTSQVWGKNNLIFNTLVYYNHIWSNIRKHHSMETLSRQVAITLLRHPRSL